MKKQENKISVPTISQTGTITRLQGLFLVHKSVLYNYV